MKRLAYLLAVMLLFSSGTAQAASQQGEMSMRIGVRRTNAARQAQAAYPDYSAESNAKRDTSLKECLRCYNLRPRQPLSQPPSVDFARVTCISPSEPRFPPIRHRGHDRQAIRNARALLSRIAHGREKRAGRRG